MDFKSQLSNFNQKVDEKRKQGLTDTAILDGLSKNPELGSKISQSRNAYGKNGTKVNNDRDLVNFLSTTFSGKMPTVASVAVKEKPTGTNFDSTKESIFDYEKRTRAKQDNLAKSKAQAEQYKKESEQANSPLGFAKNFFGAAKKTVSEGAGSVVKGAAGVGEFMGMGEFGRGIAGSIFQYTKEGKNALKNLETGKISPQEYNNIVKDIQPTNKEVIGSAAQTGLNVLTMGSGGSVAAGATAKARILKAGLQAGKVGVMYGAAEGIKKEGDTLKNTATGAVKGGITGAVIGGGLQAGVEGAKALANNAWATVLKQSPVEQTKSPKLIKQAGETELTAWNREGLQNKAKQQIKILETQIDDALDPEKVAIGYMKKDGGLQLQSGLQNTDPQMLKYWNKVDISKARTLEEARAIFEKTIPEKIRTNPKYLDSYGDDIVTQFYKQAQQVKTGQLEKTISTEKVSSYLEDLKKSYSLIPGEKSSVAGIQAIQDDLMSKPTMTFAEAQATKKAIYQHISKSYGKGTMQITYSTEAQKQIARGLKEEIYAQVPQAKTLAEKQAVFVQIDKQLEKAISRTKGKGVMGTGFGLYDLVIGTGAGASGYGIPVTGGLIVKRVAGTKIATTTAAAVNKLSNYFNNLSPTKKVLFYNAIKGLVAGSAIKTSK